MEKQSLGIRICETEIRRSRENPESRFLNSGFGSGFISIQNSNFSFEMENIDTTYPQKIERIIEMEVGEVTENRAKYWNKGC